jgi:hypothetical protein
MTAVGVDQGFDVGRVIERAFGSIKHNFGPFLILAAVFGGLPQLLLGFVRADLLERGDWANGAALGFVGGFISIAGALIIQGGVVKGAVSDQSGRKSTFGDLFETGFRHVLPLLGVGILYGLMVMIGFICLVVPGFIVMTVFCVAAPCLVIERAGVFASLQRSRDLTRGNRWGVFGVLFVFWVLGMLLALVVGFATGFGGLAAGGQVGYLPAITGGILGTIQGLLNAAGIASIYVELRAIKEGAGPQSLLSVFD